MPQQTPRATPPEIRAEQAIDKVIAGGFCVGCGACAAMAPADFTLTFTATGQFAAQRLTHDPAPATRQSTDISAVCPMSGEGPDETGLAARLWPGLPVHPEIGRHALTGVGWVAPSGGEDFRADGSSGGLLTWLAAEMLERGMVEEVIQVSHNAADAGRLFSYSISTTRDEIRRAAKSRYYPIHARDVISHMRQSGRPALFVGLPCFVKMIRGLAEQDPALRAAVRYTLGLVCGHLKSAGFAEMLAWQVGVPPDRIGSVDFRVKVPGQPASRYGFTARETPAETFAEAPAKTPAGQTGGSALMADLVGRDWGQVMIRYKACDYCDDVLAECADIAVGDAWLPPWSDEWQGTNVFVARHPDVVALLAAGRAEGKLVLEDISADRVADSQRGGLSHRREGLGWRLWKARKAGVWVPRKRVGPARALTEQRERIYDLRERIREESHAAFLAAKAAGDFSIFSRKMTATLALYAQANRKPGLFRRKLSGLKRRLKGLIAARR